MAQLTGWQFCPRCASELPGAGSRVECRSCGSIYYGQSAPAVAALLADDRRHILLARRAYEPDAGLWDVPGGFLDEGENPLEGLRRELREESGLEIEPGEFRGAYVDTYGEGERATSVLNLVWDARVVSGSPAAADDVAELRWFPLDELPPPEQCAFRWVAELLAGVASTPAA